MSVHPTTHTHKQRKGQAGRRWSRTREPARGADALTRKSSHKPLKRTTKSPIKMGRRLEQTPRRRCYPADPEPVRSGSALLPNREAQADAAGERPRAPSRVAKGKSLTRTRADEDAEQGELSHPAGGRPNRATALRNTSAATTAADSRPCPFRGQASDKRVQTSTQTCTEGTHGHRIHNP